MLYIYFGKDFQRADAKVRATVNALKTKNPDSIFRRITNEDYKSCDFEEILFSQGLFCDKHIVFFDNPFSQKDDSRRFFASILDIVKSQHVLFLLTENLSSEELHEAENAGAKLSEFSIPDKVEKILPDIFAFGDALLMRDKKKLWSLFVQKLQKENDPEKLHGAIFWGAKNLVLGLTAKNAEEAGIKQFSFDKAQKAKKHFSKKEAMNLLSILALLPSVARSQSIPLEILLEQELLKL